MDDAPNTRDIGARIERLLDDVHAAVDGRAYAVVEELVRQLTELYGAGLARIVELTRDADPKLVDRFGVDELVASLLLVHGLHPVRVEDRVEAALQSVRPFLAHHDGDVELLGIDPDAGAVLLRLLGSCDGCPSSAVTLQMAVERAIVDAAPEIVHIDVEAGAPLPARAGPETHVDLIRKPRFDSCPTEVGQVAAVGGVSRTS